MRSVRSWLVGGIAVEAVGAVVLLAWAGSPGGRLFRACLVLIVAGTTVLVLRRAPSPLAVLLALPVGLMGIVLGAGVGPRHLEEEPLVGLVGVVVLLAGLAVTATATVAGVRAVHGWRRLWAVPVAVLALVVVVPSTIAVAVSDVPPTPVEGPTPAEVGLDRAVEVRFASTDGVGLAGWWVPSRNGAAVVVLHGSGSNRSSVLDQATVLADAGYGVLAFDARGHGDSGGTGMDLGWYAEEDLGGALTHVSGLPGVDPARVGALGLSMGGEEALTLAGDPRLSAIVAEGATRRVAGDDAWLPHHPGGLLQRAMDWWQDRLVTVLSGTGPPAPLDEAVGQGTAPVLLVAAGEVPDEVTAAEHLRATAPDRVEVWVVPGSGHTEGLATDPLGWADRVVGFFDDHLLTPR